MAKRERLTDEDTGPTNSELLDQYRRLLKIDKHAIDEELMRQPTLYREVGDHYTLAVSQKDQAEAELKRIAATLDREIRDNMDPGEKKITEAGILAEIQTHADHRRQQRKIAYWRETASFWLNLKESFHQRSYMLREMTGLWISGYFADSSAGKDRRELREQAGTKNKEKVREARREKGAGFSDRNY